MVAAPSVLLSLDRLRELTPREIAHVLLFGVVDGEYARALIALFVPERLR